MTPSVASAANSQDFAPIDPCTFRHHPVPWPRSAPPSLICHMPPAARITDMHTCPEATPEPHVGGPIISGSPNVFINGLPAARVGDPLTCVGPPDVIANGSTGVFINGLPAARIGDLTAHGGVIIGGSPNVIIGEIGSSSPGFAGIGGIMAGVVMSGAVADALAHPGRPAHHHHAHAPCTGKGMATPANEKEFAHDMKTLQKDWPKLTPDARTAHMEAAVNKQLAKSGVPPVGVVSANHLSPSTNDQMNFPKWNLDMNPALINSSQLSDRPTADLGNTLFHESRHGEQWYLIARNEAGSGKDAYAVTASTGMPISVSRSAAAHPLSHKDALHSCSQQMYDSVYCGGAASRNATLTNLPKLTDSYNKALASNNKIQADPHATAAQRHAAYDSATKALKDYQVGYDGYRALPEEADAWRAGDSVGKLLGQ